MKHRNKENELKNYLSNYVNGQLEIKKVKPDIEDCFISLMKNS